LSQISPHLEKTIVRNAHSWCWKVHPSTI